MVELARTIIPAADQSFDFTCVRIHRDQRYLGLSGWYGRRMFAPAELCVHLLDTGAHGFHSSLLEVLIERGVHVIALLLPVAEPVLHFVICKVQEVLRTDGFHVAR